MADLLKASFRGVEFFVEVAADEPRAVRNIIHEFPGRTEVFVEENGEQGGRFALEMHLIGEGYEARLQELEEALSLGGPGTLLHPYRGEVRVARDGPYRTTQSTNEGGMARISVTFVESETPSILVVKIDTSRKVKANSTAALSLVNGDKLDVSGPDFLSVAAEQVLSGPQGVLAAISKVNARSSAAFGLVDTLSQTIVSIGNSIGTLVRTPTTLATKLKGLVNSIFTGIGATGLFDETDVATNRDRVQSALGYLEILGNFGTTVPVIDEVTPNREQQAVNQNEIIDMLEVSALAEAIKAIVDTTIDSAESATEIYDAVSMVFDGIHERGNVDDDLAQALRSLRASFIDHLRRQAVEVPGIGTFTPNVTTSSLPLAYQLYEDAERARELVERNPEVEHPAFLQGDVELVVAHG